MLFPKNFRISSNFRFGLPTMATLTKNIDGVAARKNFYNYIRISKDSVKVKESSHSNESRIECVLYIYIYTFTIDYTGLQFLKSCLLQR